MKIIIIAAGSSTRLSRETPDVPKGLLKINDKSIIEIQLDLFKKNLVTTHDRLSQIDCLKEYFQQ